MSHGLAASIKGHYHCYSHQKAYFVYTTANDRNWRAECKHAMNRKRRNTSLDCREYEQEILEKYNDVLQYNSDPFAESYEFIIDDTGHDDLDDIDGYWYNYKEDDWYDYDGMQHLSGYHAWVDPYTIRMRRNYFSFESLYLYDDSDSLEYDPYVKQVQEEILWKEIEHYEWATDVAQTLNVDILELIGE